MMTAQGLNRIADKKGGMCSGHHPAHSLPDALILAPGGKMATKEGTDLAKKLWTIRRTRKLSQKRMAAIIGISRSRLSHAERGRFAGERSQSLFLIRKFLEGAG